MLAAGFKWIRGRNRKIGKCAIANCLLPAVSKERIGDTSWFRCQAHTKKITGPSWCANCNP